MNLLTLRVGIDVGSTRHRVAVGLPDGKLIDEFDVDHHADVQFVVRSFVITCS